MKAFLALCLVWISTSAFTTLTCTDFTVSNHSSHALGNVLISGAANSTSVNVPAPGVFVTQTCFTVQSVTINNQTIVYPNSGVVTLPGAASVRVTFPSPNGIEVIDLMQQNSPVRN